MGILEAFEEVPEDPADYVDERIPAAYSINMLSLVSRADFLAWPSMLQAKLVSWTKYAAQQPCDTCKVVTANVLPPFINYKSIMRTRCA